jgi:hypothetical protein
MDLPRSKWPPGFNEIRHPKTIEKIKMKTKLEIHTLIKTLPLATGAVAALSTAYASTDYGPAIWRPTCPGHYYTGYYARQVYVIHDMEGYYASTISYLQGCNNTVSVHYCVNGKKDTSTDMPAGEITQMVRDSDSAWTAGCWNRYAEQTEHEGFASNPAWYTTEMYQASATLTRSKADKYGIPKDRNHIIAHGQKLVAGWATWASANLSFDPYCNSHTDPGPYWDWAGFMARINGGGGPVGPSMFYDVGGGAMNIYRWVSSGSSFSTTTQTGISSGYSLSNVGNHMAAADVNADGKTDNVVAYQYPDGTMRLHVFLNGSFYQGANGWFQSGAFNMANVGGRMVGGDFNGDGKGDVAMVYDNGGGLNIYRFLSTGSAFTYDSVVVATSGYDLANVGENIAAADVNGDGRTDIVLAYQYGDGTMRLHVLLNGNSYQGATGWFQSGTFNMANVAGRMAGGDFDGNGKGDVVMFYDNGSGVGVYRFLSSGSAFSYDLASISSGYDLNQVGSRLGTGDINGDGRADAVLAYQYPDGTFRYHAFINGNSYAGPTGWYQSGTFSLANVGGRLTMGKW